MPTRSRIVLLCAVVFAGACNSFRPVTRDSVQGGSVVRARLSQLGSAQLAPQLGPTVESIDGSVRSVSDTGVVFALKGTMRTNGAYTDWNGETLFVQQAQIDHFERAVRSPVKTGLLAGALVAAAVAIEEGFRTNGFGGGRAIGTSGGKK